MISNTNTKKFRVGFAKKDSLILLFIFLFNPIFTQSAWEKGRLKISDNGHYFQFEDGTPFFWLGETAWYLFQRLNREEIEVFLENRHQKGFNVIQAAIVRGDLKIPNQYGKTAFRGLDPEKPEEDYFQLVDWTIQKVLEKNMFIGLLPTWGDQVSDLFGTGSIRFNEKNAYSYGRFLGNRYKDLPNIIWILGGDQPAFTDSSDWRPVWRSMIKGIKDGSNGNALVTYHPWGEKSSTDFWKNEDILDFNMLQSGHARHDIPVWEWISRDFNISPAKPVLNGEPNYEDHPVNWKPENGYFRDYDVRKQLYRSVFSGGCGVTYGNQAIRQFYSPKFQPMGFPEQFWSEALDRPGAFQAGYLKNLIESRPSLSRVPDQTIIHSKQGENHEYMTSFRDDEGRYAMIYLPVGRKIEVNAGMLSAKKITAWWFNPRSGEALRAGMFRKDKITSFEPPSSESENDWVLVLDTQKDKNNY